MIERPNKVHVIPKTAWAIAIVAYLVASTAMMTALIPRSESMALKIALSFGAAAVLAIYILLLAYIYGDAKRRGMRYVMWTLLAIFIPDAIGIILYFILRDPLPATCPQCGASVLSKYTFCSCCGAPVKPICPQCGKPIDIGWSNCGHCGAKLPGIPKRAVSGLTDR
jgi:hypothetical protein